MASIHESRLVPPGHDCLSPVRPTIASGILFRRTPAKIKSHIGFLLVELTETCEWLKLSGTGLRIWDLLEYPTSLDDLVEDLAAVYEEEIDTIYSEAAGYLDLLSINKLLEWFPPSPSRSENSLRNRYLWLLKRALMNVLYAEHEIRIDLLENQPQTSSRIVRQKELRDVRLRHADAFDRLMAVKRDGDILHNGYPHRFSHTMAGLAFLDVLERCSEEVFADHVPGDFMEAGVCQGGAAIFMRALQIAHGQRHRRTWVADSFAGPPPTTSSAAGVGHADMTGEEQPWMSFDRQTVEEHFRRYDLLDRNVHFIAGPFHETMPGASVDKLAVLRLDVSSYDATLDVMENMYPRLSPGGFVLVDDYGLVKGCREAVDRFRRQMDIQTPLRWVEWRGVYWRKEICT